MILQLCWEPGGIPLATIEASKVISHNGRRGSLGAKKEDGQSLGLGPRRHGSSFGPSLNDGHLFIWVLDPFWIMAASLGASLKTRSLQNTKLLICRCGGAGLRMRYQARMSYELAQKTQATLRCPRVCHKDSSMFNVSLQNSGLRV